MRRTRWHAAIATAIGAMAGCQLVGGIDSRAVAPPSDAGDDAHTADVTQTDVVVPDAAFDTGVDAGGGSADSGDAAMTTADATVDSGAEAGPDAGAETGATYMSTVLGDSPLAYWRVGEDAGTTARDEISSDPPGQYDQPFTLGQPGAIHGDPNTAVLLGGNTASCLDTSTTTSLVFPGTTPFSLEAWVAPVQLDGMTRHVFIQETTDTNGKEGYGLFASTGGLTFQRHVSNVASSININPPPLPLNTFTYVVATYDGTSIHLYVNGAEPQASMSDTRDMPSIVGSAYVGCMGGSAGFDGLVDEIAVYDKALTASQVLTHYNVGIGH